MNIEEFRAYCLHKTGTSEGFPFDEETLVFKVANKMYALCSLERTPVSVTLKCDPDYAIELREQYPDIVFPGYHMNKQHWNTILLESDIPSQLYIELIDQSYNLVRSSLKKMIQKELDQLEENG